MNRIKELREAKGLRKEDIAARAEISYDYVQRLEAGGRQNPSIGIARRIAAALDCEVDDVFPPEPALSPTPTPTEA